MKQLTFIIFCVVLLGIIMLSCPGSQKTGTLSGTVTKVPVWPPDTIFVEMKAPVWPPDTIFIALKDLEGNSVEKMKPLPCWPPDTCFFEFQNIPFGKYKIAVVGGDSIFRTTKGKDGEQRVVSYYFEKPAEIKDPNDWKTASFIELNVDKMTVKDIDIKYSVK